MPRDLLLLILYILTIPSISAQPYTPEFVSQAVELSQQDVMPPNRQWDWLQLTSGEWLKGEVKVLYSEVLEFDSDNLGLQSFDLEDVAVLKTAQPQAVRVVDRKEVFVGKITIRDGRLQIEHQGDVQDFGQFDIVAIVSGAPKERNYWRVRASLGTNFRAGNSPSAEYNGSLNAQRRTALSRYIVDYLGIYSSANEVVTSNNNRLSSSYDIFSSNKIFYRPFYADLLSDPFQNIAVRGTLGAGAGVSVFDRPRLDMDVFLGPGLQFSRFDEVEEGENRRERSWVGILSAKLDSEITSAIDFIYTYNIQWANSASGGYTHHMKTTVEYELTGSIDFGVSYVWDYTENPKAVEDGNIPKSDDNRILFSIGYEFN